MNEKTDIKPIYDFHEQLKNELQKFVVGYDTLIDILTLGLLSNGTIIIEGAPGTAKTSVCRLFAKNIGGTFGRMQGAVDVQPADIIGVRIYDRNTNRFNFQKGPIFSNIFLADEINRMTPKAQGSLLESLAERQVTLDNNTYSLPSPFMVVATQNPYEMEGTFQLIESQKDRFTLSVNLNQLSSEDEAEILAREIGRKLDLDKIIESDNPLITTDDVKHMQDAVRNVFASPDILAYIADIVTATRKHGDIKLGVSTRGSLALLKGAQSYAAIQGRDYVIPDDVKYIVPFAFSHRLILKREALLGGSSVSKVLSDILNTVPVR